MSNTRRDTAQPSTEEMRDANIPIYSAVQIARNEQVLPSRARANSAGVETALDFTVNEYG